MIRLITFCFFIMILAPGQQAAAQVVAGNPHDRLLQTNYQQEADRMSSFMDTSLTLLTTQRDSIRTINRDYFLKLKNVNQNTQLNAQQRQQQLQQANTQWKSKVEEKLTAVQVTKFRADLEAARQRTINSIPGAGNQ